MQKMFHLRKSNGKFRIMMTYCYY